MYKLLRLLLTAAIIATIIIQLLTIFKGDLGRTNYKKLLTQYSTLLLNVETLKRTHSTLSSHKEALENNTEILILATRKVGYYQKGEKRIIIDGLVRVDKEPTIGNVIRLNLNKEPNRFHFAWLFLLSWLISFLLLLLFVPLKKN